MRRFLVIWLFTLALVVMVSPAQANLILNGSFETKTGPSPGTFLTLPNGDTSITGWTVGGDSIDYIGTYWNAQDGARSIDLAGDGPGSISQTFATVSGQKYHVEFWMAGNPDGGGGARAMLVSDGWTTADHPFSFAGGGTTTNMGWVLESFDFIAGGSPTTLIFESDMTGPYGAALDLVSVNAVPEPGTLLLLGSGLLGLVAVGRKKFRK